MTIFSDNPHDRRMERLMMTVPNFAPRGVGFRFTEAQLFITITAATPTEILAETMRQIRCPPFRKRFNEYIESEENPMTYINEKHRARFELAAKNMENVDAETEVSVHAEAYLYGGEETVTATPEEVAYLMMRIERDENFLAGHCDNIEDVDFSFLRPPEEYYGMKL